MSTKEIVILIVIGIISYLLGNFSPSITLGKFMGVDVKTQGSGNAGTTNAFRLMGWKAALITLAVDMLKGIIAVRIGVNFGDMYGGMVAFACVVVGHVYPALYKFKGGKGVATAFGAAIALNWPSAFAAFLIALIIFVLSRRMSVASICACIAYPALMYYYEPRYAVFAIPVAIFIIFNHRQNIMRIIKKEEKPVVFSQDMIDKIRDGISSSAGSSDGTARNVQAEKVAYPSSKPSPQIADQSAMPVAVTLNTENSSAAVKQEEKEEEPEPKDFYEGVRVPKLKKEEKKNISVIGSGSFGTAIANHLVHRGHNVTIYGRNKEVIEKIKETRINDKYLPYVILSDKLKYTHVLKTAASNKDIVIFAVPAQKFREVSKKAARYIAEDTIVVNLAKGIELGTLARMSEIAKETIPNNSYVALSGPSHAEEVVRNLPAGLVAASENSYAAKVIQDVFMSDKIRVYTHKDVVGVELAGALKNVAAIATGISDGMRFGNNARAALMTRATHEIARLGKKMGASETTFAGLSGIGDLMVTCSTNLSRNRRCGIYIGVGLTPEEAVAKVGTTVEGFYTAESAKQLAEKEGVDMPIVNATYDVIKGNIKPQDALINLMNREKKAEVQ